MLGFIDHQSVIIKIIIAIPFENYPLVYERAYPLP